MNSKLFMLLICCLYTSIRLCAQVELVGQVMANDTDRTPFFQAEVTVLQNNNPVQQVKTYFDGTFKIKVKANQTYQVKASYPGFADSIVTLTLDKRGNIIVGTLRYHLHKDGLRLMGYVIDRVQDLPIPDVGLVLKNVMTRVEDKYFTDVNGYYNLKLEYETNYSLKIDKRSPGIFNKFQDTSLFISTIGFNSPLDFKLDLKLGPATERLVARKDYDPKSVPTNKTVKPVIAVFASKDSVKVKEQERAVAALTGKLQTKDSIIAALDRRIADYKRVETQPVYTIQSIDNTPKLSKEELKEQQQAAEAQSRRDKQNAEYKALELNARIEYEKIMAEARRRQQANIDKENAAKAERDKIEETARLKEQTNIVERESMAALHSKLEINAKVVADSIAREKLLAVNTAVAKRREIERLERERITSEKSLKNATAKEDARRMKEQSVKLRTELQAAEQARLDKESHGKAKRDQDLKNQEIEAVQAAKTAKLLAKARVDSIAKAHEEEKKALAIQATRNRDSINEAAAQRRAQLEKELAELKNAQQEVVRNPHPSDEVEKRKAQEAIRLLQATKAAHEQEKVAIQQEIGRVQEDNKMPTPTVRTHDEVKAPNPDQDMKETIQRNMIGYYERQLKDNQATNKGKFQQLAFDPAPRTILVRGLIKNVQTTLPISGVSITVRRVNSIVAQEVNSDENGDYHIVIDSGYFYLVSFYKAGYEISKQILDLTTYDKENYAMLTQQLNEVDDFNPLARMPVISFERNSARLPEGLWGELETIVKMMKDIPDLKIKFYGMASVDEDYPMELSVSRARTVANVMLEQGIPATKIRLKGFGAYRARSGCTEIKPCTQEQYRMDRVVMYKVVKD